MFEEFFKWAEEAVDSHPRLGRDPSWEAKMVVDRSGCSCHIKVRLEGSRKKPQVIWGSGDTPWEATKALADSLDTWADAW
jgi:hypothetical protein